MFADQTEGPAVRGVVPAPLLEQPGAPRAASLPPPPSVVYRQGGHQLYTYICILVFITFNGPVTNDCGNFLTVLLPSFFCFYNMNDYIHGRKIFCKSPLNICIEIFSTEIQPGNNDETINYLLPRST